MVRNVHSAISRLMEGIREDLPSVRKGLTVAGPHLEETLRTDIPQTIQDAEVTVTGQGTPQTIQSAGAMAADQGFPQTIQNAEVSATGQGTLQTNPEVSVKENLSQTRKGHLTGSRAAGLV